MTGKRDFLVGKRVTVVGLGIEGVDVAAFAAQHGAASVTVIDAKPPEALADRMEQLREFPIRYQIGPAASTDPNDSDVVFVSQSVPLGHPTVLAARDRNIRVSSMTREFMELCPGPTIGITGSSGKTTTTSLVTQILAAAGLPYRVGGNIGIGLLGLLDGMDERTWAVMEMSHTQLVMTDRSPHVAAVLNITPNHLDQFGWYEYVALKQKIVAFQTRDDIAVLNLDDPRSVECADLTPARVVHFSIERDVPGDGAFVRDDAIFVARDSVAEMVLPIDDLPLRGRHNVANAVGAAAIVLAAGVQVDAIAAGIRSFEAVPHRLELVAEIGGVRYVNDSIATTPERTLAGIRSFDEPLVLLLGGKDKDLPKVDLAREAVQRCRAIVCFGADAAKFDDAVAAALREISERDFSTARVRTLAEAVETAAQLAQPGDVVLLSPAGTSFDSYANFEQRGDEFRALVHTMKTEAR